MTELASLLGGAILLYFGAEWFVGGASALALALRVPQLLVGLTVVAYGTSAPEIIVGVRAAATGHGDVALGNVIGSNIANIGLILGISALIRPASVSGALRRRELPMLLLTALAVPLVLLDGVVSRVEAAALLLAALVYTVAMVAAARGARQVAQASDDAKATLAAADSAGAPTLKGAPRAAASVVAGLGALLIGGNLFIDGAVSLALVLGMSERLVGLTIVAVGTSLPELITSVIASRRGHSDIAVGNVVGSNIFNVVLCLGMAAMFGSVGAPLGPLGFDVGALLLMTVIAGWCIRTERIVTRVEAGVILAAYVAFTVATVVRG